MEYSSELFWSIVFVFTICVAIVVVSGKSALKGIVTNSSFIPKQRTPWKIDFAIVLFLLYAILIPAVSLRIIPPVVPDLNLDAVSFIQSNSKYAVSSEDLKNDSNNIPKNDQKSKKHSIATQHPMARLLIRSYGSSQFNVVLCVFFLTVVCVAPLTEEFIFRVVIQGACENSTLPEYMQEVSENNSYVDFVPRWKSALAIGIPALVFALLHSGSVETSDSPISNYLLFQTTVSSLVSNITTLLIGVVCLRQIFKAHSQDLGGDIIVPGRLSELWSVLRKLVKEFYRGVVLYLLAAPFVLGLNLAAQKIFPNAIVAPVPIFLFALWVGYVYFKTRQYAVCVGMHVALNFTSFIFLFLNVRAHTFGLIC